MALTSMVLVWFLCLLLGFSCILELAAAKRCQRPCPKILKPVCGSDGERYNNRCSFSIAKCQNKRLRILSKCPKILKPVCGIDGKTYDNECLFTIAKCQNATLKIDSHGPCKNVNKRGHCPEPQRCTSRSCHKRQKVDLCNDDNSCSGRMKCCSLTHGKRCKFPCPKYKCRPCPEGYTYATGRNGCPTCRCKCAKTVYCFISPCLFASCKRYPFARCRSNYCFGCTAEFYIGNRKVDCKLP